jgi:hypothetical protein
MGYNANRNFTLPTATLPQAGNNLQNSNPSNPLTITNASTGNIQITTSTPHNFQAGPYNVAPDYIAPDEVIIKGVLGNVAANSPVNGSYYVSVVDQFNFLLYSDSGLLHPVPASSTLYIINTGIAYSTKLPYEYFLTYRLTGGHYKTQPCCVVVPFNFQNNGTINNVPVGNVQVNVDFLTFLRDINNLEGFEATNWEVIMGKYVASSSNPYTVADEFGVVTMGSIMGTSSELTYLTGPNAGAQQILHTTLITLAQFQNQVSSPLVYPLQSYTYAYDLTGVANSNEKIYNVSSLPSNLYTANGKWTIGNIYYNQHENQYRLTFTILLPAANFNGTTNPSFICGNNLMMNKLISEMAFLIADANNIPIDLPEIYCKFSQVVAKNNGSDLCIECSLDF